MSQKLGSAYSQGLSVGLEESLYVLAELFGGLFLCAVPAMFCIIATLYQREWTGLLGWLLSTLAVLMVAIILRLAAGT